jgi:hypothetical protein
MARIVLRGGTLAWDGSGRGGHQAYVLQWLESLRRGGHEVLYHDVVDADVPLPAEVVGSLERGPAALLTAEGGHRHGLDLAAVQAFVDGADAVISLGATYSRELEPWLDGVRPRILIDTDPGFTHLWAAEQGPSSVFGDHDVYFTVGANIGTPRSPVPTSGITWHQIWNPVCLDWWDPAAPVEHARFTTVASLWGQDYQPFAGELWGPKAERLRAFHALPARTGERFEIAAEADDDAAAAELTAHGWDVVAAAVVVGSVPAYRAYIHGSLGEFSVAKGLYVGTRSGWFSDRSACYLAAGRPVVVEATGFEDVLPTGLGLVAVTSLDDAVEAVKDVRGEYPRHAAAARALAEEVFAGDRVVSRLLGAAGVA